MSGQNQGCVGPTNQPITLSRTLNPLGLGTSHLSNGWFEYCMAGNSLAVQWLGRHAFTAEGAGSIPDWGTKILQASWWYGK